jgi:DNA polymerase III subunit beta
VKFTTDQCQLNDRLALASKAVPSRPSHPVLANLLITADEETQTIAITGFDLSLGIQTTLPAQVEESGSIALPAKLLCEIIGKLPEGAIAFDLANIQVKLLALSGTYQINGMLPVEYPELPIIDEGKDSINIAASAIAFGLEQTLFCASTEETKQMLTGVNIRSDSEGIKFAATDGHRLSVASCSVDDPVEIDEITIPSKALAEIKKLAAKVGFVSCQIKNGIAVFEANDTTICTRILEGQYPNYPQLIPKQFTRIATINRRSLVASLERISILADQRNSIVKLEITSDRLVISCDAADVGSGREELKIGMNGEELTIAFNAKYLLEGLKAIGSEDVLLRCNSATSPAIVVPCGDERSVYLIMPVQIRS